MGLIGDRKNLLLGNSFSVLLLWSWSSLDSLTLSGVLELGDIAQVLEANGGKHVGDVIVNIDTLLDDLVNIGNFRNKVHSLLSLLLLQLQGDTLDGTLLDSLHQVCDETGNLVSESLGGNDGDFINDLLVVLEVKVEDAVVLFDDGLGCLLDGLGSDSAL